MFRYFFRKIHNTESAIERLFSKMSIYRPAIYLKSTLKQVFYGDFCWNASEKFFL